MKAPTLGEAEGTVLLVAGGIALLAVLYVLRKAPAAVAGAVTGKNALTQNATNADGSAQAGYYGMGPAGTIGAATNAASGGYLSTFGDWLGGIPGDVADFFHPANPPTAAQQAAEDAPTTSTYNGIDMPLGGW